MRQLSCCSRCTSLCVGEKGERREGRGGWGEARGECERVLEIGERVNLKRQKT